MSSLVTLTRLAFSLTIAVCIVGCSGYSINEIVIPETLNETFQIKSWDLIGPFVGNDTLKGALYKDHFTTYGLSEKTLRQQDVEILDAQKGLVRAIEGENAKIEVFNYVDKAKTRHATVYLANSIVSETEREVVLVIDGSRNYAMWLNGVRILQDSNRTNLSKIGNKFVAVTLKKGSNFLLAKLERGKNNNSWSLSVGVATPALAKQIFKENYLSDFIVNPIATDTLKIYNGPYKKEEFSVVLLDDSGRAIPCAEDDDVAGNRLKLDVTHLNDNIYKALYITSSDTLVQLFIKGSAVHLLEQLRQKKIPQSASSDFKHATSRVEYLLTMHKDEVEWGKNDRNIVFWLNSALSVAEPLSSFNQGTFIRKYDVSSDSVAPYIIHCDPKLKNKEVPLVVVAPFRFLNGNVLQSYYLRDLDQIQLDSKFADERGFALMWLFFGADRYTPEESERDFTHALRNIRTHLSIDTNRVYILGDCLGGMKALLLSQKCPHYFAGVALSGPITMSGHDNNIPIDNVHNLYNVPIHIVHGVNDPTNVQNSRDFVSIARDLNMSVKYDEVPDGHFSFTKGYRKPGFDSFQGLKRKSKNEIETIYYSSFKPTSEFIYWIQIIPSDKKKEAQFTAQFNPKNNNVIVKTHNIKQVNLDLSFIAGSKVSITINDTQIDTKSTDLTHPITVMVKKDFEGKIINTRTLIRG